MIPTYYAGGKRPLMPEDITAAEERIVEQIIIKSTTIPTASADTVGEVRQYVGATTSSFTHGYIYECVEDNNVYSWNRVDVQPVTDLTSLENRVTAIEDVVPAQATAQNQLADKAFVNSSIANMQTTSNLVTSISSSSTDTQYPSAKCVYDIVGNIETLLQGV